MLELVVIGGLALPEVLRALLVGPQLLQLLLEGARSLFEMLGVLKAAVLLRGQ